MRLNIFLICLFVSVLIIVANCLNMEEPDGDKFQSSITMDKETGGRILQVTTTFDGETYIKRHDISKKTIEDINSLEKCMNNYI